MKCCAAPCAALLRCSGLWRSCACVFLPRFSFFGIAASATSENHGSQQIFGRFFSRDFGHSDSKGLLFKAFAINMRARTEHRQRTTPAPAVAAAAAGATILRSLILALCTLLTITSMGVSMTSHVVVGERSISSTPSCCAWYRVCLTPTWYSVPLSLRRWFAVLLCVRAASFKLRARPPAHVHGFNIHRVEQHVAPTAVVQQYGMVSKVH